MIYIFYRSILCSVNIMKQIFVHKITIIYLLVIWHFQIKVNETLLHFV